jgi:hypothetical protein
MSTDSDDHRDRRRARRAFLEDTRPHRVRITLDGRLVDIYGRTVKAAIGALNLVCGVCGGTVRYSNGNQGDAPQWPEEGLILTLENICRRGDPDEAHEIAEAIRALRTIPGDPSQRLLDVLQRPELTTLNTAVRYELTGEQA